MFTFSVTPFKDFLSGMIVFNNKNYLLILNRAIILIFFMPHPVSDLLNPENCRLFYIWWANFKLLALIKCGSGKSTYKHSTAASFLNHFHVTSSSFVFGEQISSLEQCADNKRKEFCNFFPLLRKFTSISFLKINIISGMRVIANIVPSLYFCFEYTLESSTSSFSPSLFFPLVCTFVAWRNSISFYFFPPFLSILQNIL